jgi:hypothetical protein
MRVPFPCVGGRRCAFPPYPDRRRDRRFLLRIWNEMGELPHRLRAGFFWRDADPGGRERWPGGGAERRPRWTLPLRRTRRGGCCGWSLRRFWGGRGPGRSGRSLDRAGEPRGLRLSDRGRLPVGGFWGLVGGPWVSLVLFPGSVFGLPVGPVLDRCRDLGDRLQDREEKVLDRVFRLLAGFAPKQPPRQPPPESLAEQADQCGENGERGGRRHGGYVAQRTGLVKCK